MSLLSTSFQRIPSSFLACSDIEIETHLSDMLNVLRLDIIPRNPAEASRFSFVIGASKITPKRVTSCFWKLGCFLTNCETQMK